MHKWIWGLCAALLLTTGLWGCSFSSFTDGEGRELDFTVVSRSELPEEVEAVLSQQLGTGFQTACQYEEYLYLICGYPAQKTSGYSVQVKKLTATDEAIYFQSELLGPSGEETVAEEETVTWLVVKTEYLDLPVIFES